MKRINGYFTVEAALVFPFVMGVVILIIYILFFQYDRCLMEQSAGTLAMRCCTLQTRDREELVQTIYVQAQTDDKGYVAWDMQDTEIQAKENYFTVRRSGTLRFPLQAMLFKNEELWKWETEYKNRKIDPVHFIRNYQKIRGGK